MSKPNFKIRLKNAIGRLSENMVLISSTEQLSDKQHASILGVNKGIQTVYAKALRHIMNGDNDKAYTLLADIPYYLVGPDTGKTDNDYVGTNRAYKEFDNIRHCIRMIDLAAGNRIGGTAIWNNVIVF
jgi:hypothetical protein